MLRGLNVKDLKKICAAAIAAVVIGVFAGTASAAGGQNVHWSYSGIDGPEHWGDLSADYRACKDGMMQSPIDLNAANVAASVRISTDYKPVELDILHNGHTVQFNVGNGSSMTSHGKKFDLLQIHFHTPSEHVVHGKPYPMEAHFVHASAAGALAVIGVFYKEGAENAALKPVFDNLPMQKVAAAKKGVRISPADVLPGKQNFSRYMGSLTTPPCSESVNWHVINTPVEASKAQIDAMHNAIGDNARPVQASNGRLVVAPAMLDSN